MKTDKSKVKASKFNLEKMKVAKLDSLYLINGGDGLVKDDPIDTGKIGGKVSTRDC